MRSADGPGPSRVFRNATKSSRSASLKLKASISFVPGYPLSSPPRSKKSTASESDSKLTRMAERGAPAHAPERGSAEGAVRTRGHLGGDAAVVAIAVLSAGVQRIGEQLARPACAP